jgi:hypothetical protein
LVILRDTQQLKPLQKALVFIQVLSMPLLLILHNDEKKKLSKHLSSNKNQKPQRQNQKPSKTPMQICEHFLIWKESGKKEDYHNMIEPLDPQRINDRVQELLYSLDEIPNEMAGAVLSVALIEFLDGIKDVEVTQQVACYLNAAFPNHVKMLLQ